MSIKKAVYFFKLAADIGGSSEAQYYLAMFAHYQLDGSFNIKMNFEFPDKEILSLRNQLLLLANFVESREKTHSFINLYFSSIQGKLEAMLAMGYKYWKAFGVEGNCSTSALYYNKICEAIYVQEDEILSQIEDSTQTYQVYIPKLIERKKISPRELKQKKDIFGIFGNFSFHKLVNSLLRSDPIEVSEFLDELQLVRHKADHGHVGSILQLAHYYYYGLKGVKRNFVQAFSYFEKAAELDDVSAKSSLAHMYLKGIGVPRNYSQSYAYFNDAAKSNDSRAFNGLGYIYLNGLQKEKDIAKALKYFKISSENGNPEGQFNYGNMHLMELPNLKKDAEKAKKYFTLAAHQGHGLAMYNLALMHLDGSEAYYSCELSVQLMKSAAERGKWAQNLIEGYLDYKNGNYLESVLKYLEIGFLGESTGQANAAILIESMPVLDDPLQTSYITLEDELIHDPVFQQLQIHKAYHEALAMSPLKLLFNDYFQLLDFDLNTQQYNLMKKLLSKPNDPNAYSLSDMVSFQLYKQAAVELDSHSLLKVGDYYYYGKATKQDKSRAAKNYQAVLKIETEDEHTAQASFNLGYMYLMGDGVEMDLNKSMEYYNKTLHLNKNAYLINQESLIALLNFTQLIKNKTELSEQFTMLADLLLAYDFEMNGQKKHQFTIYGLVVMFVLAYTLRLRRKNLAESQQHLQFQQKSDHSQMHNQIQNDHINNQPSINQDQQQQNLLHLD